MADSSVKSDKKKKKKRKLTSPQDKPTPPKKKHRGDEPEKEREVAVGGSSNQKESYSMIEAELPWRNLQLILSLQSKDIDLQKKVELAFSYVNLREKGANEAEEDYETVKVSRLVVFLNDWVQSLLISMDKKIRVESGDVEACLDYRCWLIFKFCLEESLRLQVSLSLSRNLLRAFCCIARNALLLLAEMSLHSKDLVFIGKGFELYNVVLDCVSLVFLSHGGLSNENLDLWISTVCAVLELVHKIYDENLDVRNAGDFALRFSCLLLEPFAKFLRVHPTRKTGFRDFVDELLGPLLHSLGVLHLHFDGSNPGLTRNLLTTVEEVLSQGLFHSIHIDGFLSLRSTEKYSASSDGKMKESKTVIKSYHRHLFDKLERIMASKKDSELSGLGELFQLLVDRVKNQKVASILSEDKMAEKTEGFRHLSGHSSTILHQSSSATPENSYGSSKLTAEKRKLLFDFFVQIMEPLFLQMNGYLQTNLEVGPLLPDVHCILKSTNHLLATLFQEQIYIKTEDISEGACFNFLKKVYNTIFSFSTKLLSLPTYDMDNQKQERLTLLAKQLFVAVQYFLDIECEVIENDLTSLWFMVLSYLALGYSFKNVPYQWSLNAQILGCGCQLVKLYGELRQVENTIFALCKAMRLIIVQENSSGGEQNYGCFGSCATFLPYEAYAKSLGMLLCAQEFKVAIQNGIKSIPEGQASECIRQLIIDISESMEWMKSCFSVADKKELQHSNTGSRMLLFDLQAELCGRGLSEMYALVLDSLTVTVGNSNLVGRSVKDLITEIRPSMSILAGLQPDRIPEFLSYITGKTSDKRPDENKHNVLNFGVSTHLVFVFFFRLYMSCQSLYRQAITLMPPDTSRKMSSVMQDSLTAYSGRDSMERTDWPNEGYFSWIVRPSASLLLIIQSVSDLCLQGSNSECSPLIYVLHAMALQRLVDLNRQINSLQYILQRIDGIIQVKLLDDASLSLCCKRRRKWRRVLSALKEEAEGLTEFITGYLSLFDNDRVSVCANDNATCQATYVQDLDETDKWDLDVCSVTKESLPTAIWWIICQNFDIWSIHASSKKLKTFLSHVICTCLPSITRDFTDGEKNRADEAGSLNKITVHQISSELLTNSILYEHKFVCKHLASTFCRLLKKSVLSLFRDFSIGDVDLNSCPNWQEILSAVGSLPMAVPGSKPVTYDKISEGKPSSHLLLKMPLHIDTELKGMKFTTCQSFLRLLCWMPKGCMRSKSFSLFVTYLLNLEWHVIRSLSEFRDVLSSHKQHELLILLVSCRRALKYIFMAFNGEKTRTTQSPVISVLSEGLFSVSWFFKSVFMVVGLQETLSKHHADEIRDIIFSLLDHTSHVFLTLSKYHSTCAIDSIIAKKPQEEKLSFNISEEHIALNESDPCFDSSENSEAWKSILLVAESLKDQTQGLLISLKDGLINEKAGCDDNLNKLSSIVSCISGFLLGLSSVFNHTNATNIDKVKLLGRNSQALSKIDLCINVFADFISFILHLLFVEDDHRPRCLSDDKNVQKPSDRSCLSGSEEFSDKKAPETDTLGGAQNQELNAAKNCSTSLSIHDNFQNASMHKYNFQLEEAGTVASILSKLDTYEVISLNKCLLQSLIKGDHPEAAILLRQLLNAASALLRLNLPTNYASILSSLVPSCFGLSNVLLLKLAEMSEVPQPFSFVWLDGVLNYLQELGSYFPKWNLTLHAKLIELHLNALGKCITLQGKMATLASHETESSDKILWGNKGSSEISLSLMSLFLDEFRAKLKMSFKVLISKSSDLHVLSAIQAIERALVGVHEGCKIIYNINTGSADGGKFSATVAAGIDCLDLVLEYVSGKKCVSVVKRHIKSLIAALFNIILHLQSPLVFCDTTVGGSVHKGPDPGAVILMCVQVLTRVSAKKNWFQMDSWHVGQSLRIPAALFQHFGQLSKGPLLSDIFLLVDNQDSDPVAGMHSCVVDQRFSIELFSACCRLLYTTLKNHTSKSEQCISLLQESSCVLLHCLEMVGNDLTVRQGHFSWGVQEGVKCACFLRRIYEELRQKKDVFGRHCFKFLSNYIWVYSGYGPLKTGIRREIDEALKPGVYAIIDACSADDLQHLHSVFGEGPCRNTLANLQHDYKLNFQYEGKV
ncbi:hypothetical protein P3X46_034212 [Hevea brasiliensis]|uniref:Nucleolar 27S pre-rRNA processing Urb2/Npa2 C-terminal domain-containing protein n=1 Tax=Hevea brasiliensis TaxID=3981 RepID=A0ABQ9KBH5_HEVBR|nr:uncharacterized protein LOC110672067 isoform X1 [Hevea brasiliensis]KAJ9130672.1 hypothetical protein P3X46_034212 [Hevea brasiliensis]